MGQFSGVDREAIWNALFAVFDAKVGSAYITIGQHHVQPPQLALEQQPAFFLVQTRETRSRSARAIGTQVKLMLSGFIILYFEAPPPLFEPVGEETVLGSTKVNAMLKAIDDAMLPDDPTTGKFTIGGLVSDCWVEGDVDMDPGIYSQQGAAILPVKILVP